MDPDELFRRMIEESRNGVVDMGELDELLADDELAELERRGLVAYIGPGEYMVPTRVGNEVRFSPQVVEAGHHLLAEGKVKRVEGEDDVWVVKDQYTVVSDGVGYGKCSCPHGEKGTPVGVSTCKHVFAVCMKVREEQGKE